MNKRIDWTAPLVGNDWRDEDVLRATGWLKSFVPVRQMQQRLESAESHLLDARDQLQRGEVADLHDPSDVIAWYILQAETFAIDRRLWVPDTVARIIPFITRIGKELELLKTVGGVEKRAQRIMLSEKRQPDGGIYELLVALAYRRNGWSSVEFVDERPGVSKTPDIFVARPRKRWAVECKRLEPSRYAAKEREKGTVLAKFAHNLLMRRGISIVLDVLFKQELSEVPDHYLEDCLSRILSGPSFGAWDDNYAFGVFRPINWIVFNRVIEQDFVYYGSSRMIELLCGRYDHGSDYSMSGVWVPSSNHPFYATKMEQASVVKWVCVADESRQKKAKHFKSTLAKAESQLPGDRPGVIHVGIETGQDAGVAMRRHLQNVRGTKSFENTGSRLRWVYGNYFVPELTTAQNESWAMTETMVPYKIGNHRTSWPLPRHMIVSPEGEGREGVYWDDGS